MRGEERGPWYLITALVIGVSLGLLYAWVISPVEYVDTAPSSLRADFKDYYRTLVAVAYAANGDLARAQARLDQLNETDMGRILTMQAQRAVADGRPQAESYALGLLAMALSQGSQPVVLPGDLPGTDVPVSSPSTSPTSNQTRTPSPTLETATQTPSVSTPEGEQSSPGSTSSATPTVRNSVPTITPLPSRTPTPTPGTPFVLKREASLVCNPNLNQSLIIVEAYDRSNIQVPGVQVIVRWPGGEDRFFTGLKPELGLGYADFNMEPGVIYTVQLAEGGQPVAGLTPNECETPAKERYWGSWRLVFAQP